MYIHIHASNIFLFKVSVDNFTFKLFYKWSVSLFIAGSVVVVSSQFFGDPISCETVNIVKPKSKSPCKSPMSHKTQKSQNPEATPHTQYRQSKSDQHDETPIQ